MSDKVVAEFGEAQRQAPEATEDLLGMEAFEHHPHGEKIAQADRRLVRPVMRGAPAAHAGPARQIER